ncbi:MAG: hypothetical protein J6K55_12375 [Clostridia bacterium]|nr:hypothetical protein [Clostridia bacterium]
MKPGMRMYLLNRPDGSGGEESREDWGNRRRQPTHYTGSGMHEDWPEETEMRRRRDEKGRFMMDDDDMPEDARSYEARPEYQPHRNEYGRVESRYMPSYPIIQKPSGGLYDGGGGLGFGTRSHYGTEKNDRRQTARVGGTMWMEPEENEPMVLDKKTAEKWVQSMHGEDAERPSGGRWTMEELKPMAQKFGIEPDTEKFLEFWVMTNAFYNDFCEVAKKNGITSPEFYGMMAIAWMKDKDAMPGKTARYYKYIVQK